MYTIRDVIESANFDWYHVLSGGDRLADTPVEYVSVIEIPVEDFVRKNELVLSTAMGCLEDDALFYKLVSDVHHAGASALILSMRDDRLDLPQTIRHYLDKTGFPVLQIPWAYRFSHLVEVVLRGVREKQRSEAAFYEAIQKQLLSAYLDNQGIGKSVQIMANALNCGAAIFDANYRQRGHWKLGLEEVEFEQLDRETGQLLEIKTNNRLYGYLYLQNPAEYNMALFQQYLIPPLAFCFDREWAIQSARENARYDFVWELAKSPFTEAQMRQGELLGFQMHHPYTCIVGKAYAGSEQPKQEDEQWISRNIIFLEEESSAITKSMQKEMMITCQQGMLILFLQNPPGRESSHIQKFLDTFEKKIGDIFPQVQFIWGISETTETASDFHEMFLHALLAQELCANSAAKENRYTYENTVVFHILSTLYADNDVKEQINEIVRPILEHDQDNQANLMETLKAFLSLKNVSETARSLHLHRQSLIYRLNKIEELTGLSLRDPNGLFLLEVCVRMQMHFG